MTPGDGQRRNTPRNDKSRGNNRNSGTLQGHVAQSPATTSWASLAAEGTSKVKKSMSSESRNPDDNNSDFSGGGEEGRVKNTGNQNRRTPMSKKGPMTSYESTTSVLNSQKSLSFGNNRGKKGQDNQRGNQTARTGKGRGEDKHSSQSGSGKEERDVPILPGVRAVKSLHEVDPARITEFQPSQTFDAPTYETRMEHEYFPKESIAVSDVKGGGVTCELPGANRGKSMDVESTRIPTLPSVVAPPEEPLVVKQIPLKSSVPKFMNWGDQDHPIRGILLRSYYVYQQGTEPILNEDVVNAVKDLLLGSGLGYEGYRGI